MSAELEPPPAVGGANPPLRGEGAITHRACFIPCPAPGPCTTCLLTIYEGRHLFKTWTLMGLTAAGVLWG